MTALEKFVEPDERQYPEIVSINPTPAYERIHALDAVRAFAMLLGIVHHSTLPYIKDVGGWAILEVPNNIAATIFYVIHWLRMPVFFLIAGFFGRTMLERKGPKAFVKDRAKRILVPLILGFFAVAITVVIAYVLGALASGMTMEQVKAGMQQGMQQGQAKQPASAKQPESAKQPAPAKQPEQAKQPAQAKQANQPEAKQKGGGGIQLAHLWFLYYLLMFYAAALVMRPLLGRFAPSADAAVRVIMKGVWAPVILATPLIAYFYTNKDWLSWYGIPSPGYSLVPSVAALLGYGMIFGLGWLLHRQADLLFALAKRWPVYLGAAVVLSIVCLSIAGLTPRWKPYLHGRELLLYTVAYMTGVWCWAFGLVGAGLRFLADASPVRRYIADSSYWLYLMHLSAIVFFTTLFIPLHWPWIVKYLLTIAGSTAVLLLTYRYLVRYTWIGAILNGRRHRRVRAEVAPAAATS